MSSLRKTPQGVNLHFCGSKKLRSNFFCVFWLSDWSCVVMFAQVFHVCSVCVCVCVYLWECVYVKKKNSFQQAMSKHALTPSLIQTAVWLVGEDDAPVRYRSGTTVAFLDTAFTQTKKTKDTWLRTTRWEGNNLPSTSIPISPERRPLKPPQAHRKDHLLLSQLCKL